MASTPPEAADERTERLSELRDLAAEDGALNGLSCGVTILGATRAEYRDAVTRAGARLVPLGKETRGIVWLGSSDEAALERALQRAPHLQFVQLPSAGVDRYLGVIEDHPRCTWLSAAGAYGLPVAEHALALILALLRHLPERARSSSWGAKRGTLLTGSRVLIIGAGGIAEHLAALLRPFGVHLTVCRRALLPAEFADATIPFTELTDRLHKMDVVVIAAPHTLATHHLMDRSFFAALPRRAVVVNVARGAIVDTDALVQALDSGAISGAALDVTDPEPLPDGHPLWSHPSALITPHSADTPEMIIPLLAARIEDNVRRFIAGKRLLGQVDRKRGY